MVLYEMGYAKIAFTFSVAAATVGSIVAAVEVMNLYSPHVQEQPDEIM
jgi:hypothetical protein